VEGRKESLPKFKHCLPGGLRNTMKDFRISSHPGQYQPEDGGSVFIAGVSISCYDYV
jgi:hypothetical protein